MSFAVSPLCHSPFLPFCHSLFLLFCHFDRSGEISERQRRTRGSVPLHCAPRTEVAGVILPVRGAPMQRCCPRTEVGGAVLPVRGAPMQRCCPRTEVGGVMPLVRGAPMQKCCPRTEVEGVILPVRGAPMQRCCPRTEVGGAMPLVRGEWRRGHPAAQPPYSIIFSMHFTAARRVSSSMTISSPPLPLRHARTSTSVVARMLLHTRSFESA